MDLMLDLASEVIGDRRDPVCGLRRDNLPGSCDHVAMPVGRMSLHGEKANLRVVGRLHFFRSVARELERQLHVGLAAAQPDVADQDVVQFHGFVAGDPDGVRAAGGRRLNLHLPAAVGARNGRCGLAVQSRTLILSPGSDQPQIVFGFAALQNHVVAEDGADERERLGCRFRCALDLSAAIDRKQEHYCGGHTINAFGNHEVESLSPTQLKAMHQCARYSGSILVRFTRNVPVTVGAPVSGWPPPMDTE